MFLFQNVPVDVRSIEIVQLDALATVLRGSPVARVYTLLARTAAGRWDLHHRRL